MDVNFMAIVPSLITGATSMMYARRVAHRSEEGRGRHSARTSIHELVRSYRDTMIYQHDRIESAKTYGSEYVSSHSAEVLAEGVIRESLHLSRWRRKRLHRELTSLVGAVTFRLAERHAFVDPKHRSPDHDSSGVTAIAADLLKSGTVVPDDYGHGDLGAVRKDVLDGNAFARAVGTLDRIIKITK